MMKPPSLPKTVGALSPHDPDASYRIRPSTPHDLHRLRDFFDGLSSPARCNRFLSSIAKVSTSLIELFAKADQKSHVAIIATQSFGQHEIIIAEARFIMTSEDDAAAEFALTVADDWQGQGIGSRLLGRIGRIAGERGLQSLWADTSPTNAAMLGLAKQHGFKSRRHPQDFRLARLERLLAPLHSLSSQVARGLR